MKSILTAIVIAKNEQERIAACLTSLAWADHIIVVDNGSIDETVAVSKKQGAMVVTSNEKDFASVRDTGLHLTDSQWVLYVDADEEISEPLREEIKTVISAYAEGLPIGYFIKRDSYYLGHHWPYKDKVERLFLRSALRGWHGALHETPLYVGAVGTLKYPLTHRTHRTLAEMVTKTNEWSALEAKLRLDAHHPTVVWWRLIRVMMTGFWRSFVLQDGWKAGTVGWIESIYQGFSMFITYAKLWEMQQKIKN